MKFIMGFLTGVIVGALGAVAYSVQTGRDLREEYEGVRSDLSKRDLDALSSRLESRVSEMQTILEERIGQVRDKATAAVDEARSGAADAADAAGEAAQDAADAAAETMADAAEAAQEKAEA
jgi:gas vesicle protein